MAFQFTPYTERSVGNMILQRKNSSSGIFRTGN